MTAIEIIEEFDRYGIKLKAESGKIRAIPGLDKAPAELIAAARECRAEILSELETPADENQAARAIEIIKRLRGYTLPAGRIPVAREMASRLSGLDSPAQITEVLEAFETELIKLGGEHDPDLAEAVEAVTKTFPGSALVGVRSIKQ